MVTLHQFDSYEGLDALINRAQTAMQKLLGNLGWVSGDVYGRAVPLEVDNQLLPHAYLSNGDYTKDLVALDGGNLKVFFLPTGEVKYLAGGQLEQVIKTVFVVDLSKQFGEATHLADLDAQSHMVSVMEMIPTFKNIQGITIGAKEVLKGYYSEGKVKLLDVWPKHIFSVNSSVKYFSKKPMYNCNC